MYFKWKGNTIEAGESIAKAFQFSECSYDKRLIEFNFLLDIYDGNLLLMRLISIYSAAKWHNMNRGC